jgi:hypothetical protein
MDTSCQAARQRHGLRLALAAILVLAGAPVGAAEWKFDVLHLKNGNSRRGLLIEETREEVRFQCVHQSAGQRTWVFHPAPFHRDQIKAIVRLEPQEREQLAAKLRNLKASDPNGEEWQRRMNELQLVPIARDREFNGGLRFEAEHFVLDSNANEQIVRRAAIRLEDIYAAYSSYLPPRRVKPRPTRILLIESVAEYQKWLQKNRVNIFNVAFFDRKANLIVCVSDLNKMGEDLAAFQRDATQLRTELNKMEAILDRLFGKGMGPVAQRQQIAGPRLRLVQLERYNEGVFNQITQRLFHTLYHEAFHAYLDNFVYDPEQTEVPRWLNEGLAQIFESAIVEAGELRVGHADPARLKWARDALKKEHLWVPLAELLKARPEQYLALHGSDAKQSGDRYYLTAWALAFYLTFDRNLLGSDRLDHYVVQSKRGSNPLEAFAELVDQPLPQFEKDFRHFMTNLQPDGTVKVVANPR